jgi:hypothetical protein
MSNKNCRAMQALLSAFLDQELTGEEGQTVLIHLAQCPVCRLDLRQLQQISAVLPTWEVPAVDPRLADRLSARLTQHRQLSDWRRPLFSLRRLAWAGMTIAAIAGMIYGFRSPHRPVLLAQREESHVASIIVSPSTEGRKIQVKASGVIVALQSSPRKAHHGGTMATKHRHAPIIAAIVPVSSPPDAGSTVVALLTEAMQAPQTPAPPAGLTMVMMASSNAQSPLDDPTLAVVSCLTETK